MTLSPLSRGLGVVLSQSVVWDGTLSLQPSLPHLDTLPWLLTLVLVCHLDQKAVYTRGLVGSHLPQLPIVGQWPADNIKW